MKINTMPLNADVGEQPQVSSFTEINTQTDWQSKMDNYFLWDSTNVNRWILIPHPPPFT